MTMFLCYDLKAVQGFIFRIPRLRFAIGGSALLDRFDRRTAPDLQGDGVEHVFSGGGRGAFLCRNEAAAERVEQRLVRAAHDIGADIAIGRNADYSEAAHHADFLYPYLPEKADLGGEPCPESALYPVSGGRCHPVIARRMYWRGEPIVRYFEEMLLRNFDPHPALSGRTLEFFHNVSPEEGANDPQAEAASNAIGGRNRWALIAMDGNDMGAQFRARADSRHPDVLEWLKAGSDALDRSTRDACSAGIAEVVRQWMGTEELDLDEVTYDGRVVLPVRPILVGGDDLVSLCHPRHAFSFVQAAGRRFEQAAAEAHTKWKSVHGSDLWPATGGRMTISAGVLFAPVSLPLASAIEYAEALLRMAKGRGRTLAPGRPSSAAVDWESVTGGLLEHPAAARSRDWIFEDGDLGEKVRLTRRPYLLQDFDELLQLKGRYAGIPSSLRHRLRTGLRTGFADRQVLRARVGKRHAALFADLEEPERLPPQGGVGRWFHSADYPGARETDILDALDLLGEDDRLTRDTTGDRS